MSKALVGFHGRVIEGKIKLDAPTAWRALLYSFEGKEVELRLCRYRQTRSLSQNAYYWGVVVALLSEYTGYDPDDMHEALKLKFLVDRFVGKFGLIKVKSTTDLDTGEMTEYIEQVRQWAAAIGCVIPDASAAAGGL